MSLGCHSVKVLSTTVGYSLVAVITELCCHLTYDSRGAWHRVYAMLLSICETLPEIQTMEKCDFLKSIIYYEIIKFCVTHDNCFEIS